MKEEVKKMGFPKNIQLREVCPRDGWQKFPELIPTETKIGLIREMIGYGARELEIGVFSENPKLTRQYGDLDEIIRGVLPQAKEMGVRIHSLVNNYEDACRSVANGIMDVGLFISVSDRFGQGFGTTAEEGFQSLERIQQIPGIRVCLNLGAVFGCPFGDDTSVEKTIGYAKRAAGMGVKEFGLADSAGKGSPNKVRRILKLFLREFPAEQVALHLHNTEGFGLANAFVAMELGIARFDVSLGAMGGCPVIPNAKGNIATEDFVNLLEKMGLKCSIDLAGCIEASLAMSRKIGSPVVSSMAEIHRQRQMDEMEPPFPCCRPTHML